ncbi:hypothetical protein [Flavobacterium hydatis]|nr:hypothetical protein [Flavobacterium hydatis]
MKKSLLIMLLLIFAHSKISAKSNSNIDNSNVAFVNEYETTVNFPAGYAIGDYVEFVGVSPFAANASGYYQISISYTRNDIAAAATHLASVSHSNPAIWRETGRINNNPYLGNGVNFTIDCNTEYGSPRFRIRAINTLGQLNNNLVVDIKVTSINLNGTYRPLNATGNDLTVTKFVPMTSDWDLYVGDSFTQNGANLAIKAIRNGNIGIGTAKPDEKLTVNGKIHAQEVRIDLNTDIPVPDYVFANDYKLKSLQEVEEFIKRNSHLPEIPSAKEIEKNGLMLAEMNMSLLKKMEEMTLYMIEQEKISNIQSNKIEILEKENEAFKSVFERLSKIEKKIELQK